METEILKRVEEVASSGQMGTPRILLVEDDESLLSSLSLLLTHSGYDLQTARDGEEALVLLNRASFDLVITDVLMPKADGLEMMQQIRKRWPDLKVIAISGGGYCGAGMYLDLCLKFGAAQVLEKPFTCDKLLDVLRERLQTASEFCAAAGV